MDEFKSNSHRSKAAQPEEAETEKKVEKVVTGAVSVRKKSGFREFTEDFLTKDVNSVKNYVLLDVLIPAVKKAISDIVTNGIDMLLYGESGGKRTSGMASKVSYRNYYDQRRDREDPAVPRAKTGYRYDEVVFDTRGDAESVLMRMEEIIDEYGMVAVADLYDLADIKGNHTDYKYGWTDLRMATPVRVRDGFVLQLPKAMPLS